MSKAQSGFLSHRPGPIVTEPTGDTTARSKLSQRDKANKEYSSLNTSKSAFQIKPASLKPIKLSSIPFRRVPEVENASKDSWDHRDAKFAVERTPERTGFLNSQSQTLSIGPNTNYFVERKKLIESLVKSQAEKHPKKLPALGGRSSQGPHQAETLFTAPTVVVENAETEESDSHSKSRRRIKLRGPQQKNPDTGFRKRDFKLKVYSRKNMFEGFSFFQYDQYIVNDSTMQKVVVRDQLIIFMDKVNTLKNEIYDDALTKRIVMYISPEELKSLNTKVEEVLSIMNELIKLLLFDIIDELDNIKLSKSPLEPLQMEEPKSEQDLYVQNSHLVKKVLEHFREGVECYMVLCRQSRSNRVLDDINCYLILQFIERGRFGTGMVLQRLRHLKVRIVNWVI